MCVRVAGNKESPVSSRYIFLFFTLFWHKAIPSKQASSFHQNDIIPDDPDGVFDSTAEQPSLYGDRSLVGSPQDETIVRFWA